MISTSVVVVDCKCKLAMADISEGPVVIEVMLPCLHQCPAQKFKYSSVKYF